MPIVAVVNRKGGSGKSTLATHLAAYCAHQGLPVLLGDADFQQSSHAWLRLRAKQRYAPAPKIVGWSVDPRNVLRAPPGITHVVLDTPGGLKGYELLRVVMLADAVLVPVSYSMFDRESAAECIAELRAHPRVVRGRCRIAAVGMRIDSRTRAEASLREWAAAQQIEFLGTLRETQTYVKCLEHGLTLFDMPAGKVEADLAQWAPILQWLRPVIAPAQVAAPLVPLKVSNPLRVRVPGAVMPGGMRAPLSDDVAARVVERMPAAAEAAPATQVAASAPAARVDASAPAAQVDATIPAALPAEAELPSVLAPLEATADGRTDGRAGVGALIGRWLAMISPRSSR
ncbi:MAG: ParA family protein [Burkholderiaceae bacterium]